MNPLGYINPVTSIEAAVYTMIEGLKLGLPEGMGVLRNGIDAVETHRVDRMVARRSNLHHVYTPVELEYKGYAMCFAAKEAVSKALGTGISTMGRRELGGVRMNEMEIPDAAPGMSLVNLYGKAKAVAEERGIDRMVVSMVVMDGNAIAVVQAGGKSCLNNLVGNGVGAIEISSVYRMVDSFPIKTLKEIYTPKELGRFQRYRESSPTYLAAKRAVSNIFGNNTISLNEVEVMHTPLGEPLIALSGKVKEATKAEGIEEIIISITTIKEMNTAIAIAQALGR